MGWGDEILAAGAAQRLYEDTGQKVAITDRGGAVRWNDIWLGNPAIATPTEAARGRVQFMQNGPNARPYHAKNVPLTRLSGVKFTDWRARDHRGRLYLTDAERERGRRLRADGPYWLIEPSPVAQSNQNKRWPFDRFERVAQRVPVRLVQLLHDDSHELMKVSGTRTPTFRDACGVLASAEGYIGTEGGLHHAAAALGIPAVVIFGGCMSVETFGYPEHINLADNGPESPCGRWMPCTHCVRAMAAISAAQVLDAVHWLLDAR